jgi:hypothetical protein
MAAAAEGRRRRSGTERPQQPRDGLPEVAHADDAGRGADQARPVQPGRHPSNPARADCAVGLADPG